MVIIDILLLACFIPALMEGVSNGLIKQIVSLVAIFLGTWCAFHFSTWVSSLLQHFITVDPQMLGVISFVIIVIAVIVGLHIVGLSLTKAIEMIDLGWLNRILGFVFAIAKTVMILGICILVFEAVNEKYMLIPKETIEVGLVYNALKETALVIFPYLEKLVIYA